MVLTVQHGVNIAAAIILLSSLIVLLIHWPLSLRLNFKEKVLFAAMLCLPLIIALDVSVRDFRFRYFDFYARFILALPIYFACRQAVVSVKPFVTGLLIGSIGAGLLAIYQWHYVDASNVHGYVIKISFGNISLLLGMMSLASLFLIRQYRYQKLFFISCLLAFAMGLVASALSGSRGGWVALPFFIILFTLYFPTQKRTKLAGIFLLTSFMAMTYHSSAHVKSRVNLVSQEMRHYFATDMQHHTQVLQTSSIGLRMEVWKAAWLIFQEHPFIGVGSGNFNTALQEKIAAGEVADIYIFDHAHNEPLHLMAILGLLGVFGYAVLYGGLLYYFYQALISPHIEAQYLGFLGVMLVGANLIFGLSNYSFGHQVNVVFLAVMTMGIAGMISCFEQGHTGVDDLLRP